MRDRALSWDGLVNVRDLGGHPTEDGRETRFGEIVRADSVRRLSDEGWAALVGYGIRTILDLRFHEDLEADPPQELPVDVVHVALFPEPSSPDWDEIDAIDNAAGSEAPVRVRNVYLELLERRRPKFASSISAVARAPQGGVLVHCQAGKDRTGLVSAILLRLAGVGVAAVADDYALSGVNLAARSEQWIAEASDEKEREHRRMISVTSPDTMRGVLEELERRHGTIEGYLRAGGAENADLARAQQRLVG